MSPSDKPLVWLRAEVKTPPFSRAARREAGYLLRRLQQGERLGLPHSRPLARLGKRVHELRIQDEGRTWRIVYRVDTDAIVIGDVLAKKSNQTPRSAIANSQRRFKEYDDACREEEQA